MKRQQKIESLHFNGSFWNPFYLKEFFAWELSPLFPGRLSCPLILGKVLERRKPDAPTTFPTF